MATSDDSKPAQPAKRRNRRVVTPPPAGSDPQPAAHGHPERWDETGAAPRGARGAGENDERLKNDKPPHWG
ncbi:hypothetical protein [Leucobacter chinensis]|uniref:hypothetical protein n=1 Tax=Leucobacter chinensis TaxID=2851010 RepID=UPI001C23EA31|nr:hypothetical protein [Leucobacter chinensis]